MGSIKERFLTIIKFNGLTINGLANQNKATQKRVSNQIKGDAEITLSTLMLLLDRFPELSADWLLRGEGDMYRNSGNQSIIMENKGIVGNNNSGNSVNIGSTPNIAGEGAVPCGLSLKYHNVEIPMEKILELIKSIKL